MSAQSELQAALEAENVPTETSLRGRSYDMPDGTSGRVWVLADSYDIASSAGQELTVAVAVTMGKDLMAEVERVWAALEAIPGVTPVSYETAYGGTPIPGRDMPDGDYANIGVVTRNRL